MSKKYRTYPEEFKLSVIRDYYSSGVSRYACAKKHGIASLLLRKWLLKYAGEKKAYLCPPKLQVRRWQTAVRKATVRR